MKTMGYKWALSRYPAKSDRTRKILELADFGVGYHIINKSRGKSDDVIAAFKLPVCNPLPLECTYASPAQISSLDRMDAARRGGRI